MAVGSKIEDLDYNQIAAKIANIMGSGAGQFGYGQAVVSSPVSEGTRIEKTHWDALRFDILNSRLHQDGLLPSVIEAVRGQVIRYGAGHPNLQYNSQTDVAIANKFNIGVGQYVIDSAVSTSRSTPWSVQVASTITATFGSADYARWFFNSGGKIRITSTRTGGSSSAQNNSWSALLNTAGSVEFDAVNFYNSTTTPEVLFFDQPSFPYSASRYSIKHSCNIANNSNGGATIITLAVLWEDIYQDTGPLPPPDSVDGTLSLVVDELRAFGILLPAGTPPFVIARPTYTITPISGS
jgi:hypothetical protein